MTGKRMLGSLLVAFVISALSCWIVARRISVAAAPASVRDLTYVIAANQIQPGQALKVEDLQVVNWPGDHPLEGAQASISALIGREALFPLAKGEPVLDRHLSAPGSGVGLASKIPEGMRAVTLRSDEVVGVAGFLIPGSHVDVLVTYHTPDGPDSLTATVLQNVIVIAVGHEIQPDPVGKPADVTIVTLLLSPEDVQRAVLASVQGQIHFVLRSGADQTTSSSTPVKLSQLGGRTVSAPRPSSQPRTAPTPKPTGPEIETVLAGQPQSSGANR